MSSQREQYKAQWKPEILTEKRKRKFLQAVVPIDGFKSARGDVVELFSHSYSEIDEARESFENMSNPAVREWALKPYSTAPDYDPHGSVTAILSIFDQTWTNLKRLLLILLVIAKIGSIEWLYSLEKGGMGILELVESMVPLSIIGIGIAYIWFLKMDTFTHQFLARKLRAGKMKVNTRERSKIVGYGIWNRSLHGQTGLLLVAFFYFLQSLPRLPILNRWFDDPALFLKNIFKQNVGMFYHTDSWIGATKHLYRRYR